MNRHAVVVGAAGFIGSNLASSLLSNGWKVTGIDSFSNYYARSVKQLHVKNLLVHPDFSLVEQKLEMRTFHTLAKSLGQADALIDAAAIPGVQYSFENSDEVMNWNTETTRAGCELAIHLGVRHYVFLSSSSVYGKASLPFTEDMQPLVPLSPYAYSKLRCEQIIQQVMLHTNISRWVLRLFSVYGSNLRPDLAMAKFASLIVRREPITIFGGLDSSRDYTHTDDIAEAIIALLGLKSNSYETLNICRNEGITLRNLVHALSEIFNIDAKIEIKSGRNYEPLHTLGDNSRCKTLLGFSPRISFSEGIARITPWLLASHRAV